MDLLERGFDHRGIPVHYLEGGVGFPLLLIHGSGPGASSIGNWKRVLEPLAARYHVFAMDLIGFGRSGRKADRPYFDLDLWFAQCQDMLERMPGPSLGLIGHSLSGALALKLAASNPRIGKVMTTASLGAVFAPNPVAERAWTFPRNRDALRETAECLIHDKRLIDDAYLENRERVLFSGDYATYFSSMFEGDKRRFIDAAAVSAQEFGRIQCDVLMVHGREDEGFPAELLTVAMSRALPHADVALIGRCSHSIAFEQPHKFLALAESLFGAGGSS